MLRFSLFPSGHDEDEGKDEDDALPPGPAFCTRIGGGRSSSKSRINAQHSGGSSAQEEKKVGRTFVCLARFRVFGRSSEENLCVRVQQGWLPSPLAPRSSACGGCVAREWEFKPPSSPPHPAGL
ncbi:uncharacterized [Tachysurus ichikawai]